MDGFGDNFDQAEVDPAAEFLAREKDQLAGLEDELEPSSTLNGDNNETNGTSGASGMQIKINKKNEENLNFDRRKT